MRLAFEDQIVQKVMPKLRGIETRGEGEKSLNEIKKILEDRDLKALTKDFDFAMQHGYGQFIWNSANYLEKNSYKINETTNENVEG